MSFIELDIKDEYRSKHSNVIREFYIPLLSEAKEYCRAVGYFSSGILAKYAVGLKKLIDNGGSIKIVASPNLTEEDLEAMEKGYELRETILKKALIRELVEPISLYEKQSLNILANYIAYGKLDFKIAMVGKDIDSFGIYHEKLGLMYDDYDNIVAFSGSNNESVSGVSYNYETLDVYCSWGSEFEKNKVREKRKAFEGIWSNKDTEVEVLEFPEVKAEFIKKYKYSDFIDDDILANESLEESDNLDDNEIKTTYVPRVPGDVLYDYQKLAIENWKANNYRGIFDMATGTGKTYTGLGAISELSQKLNDKLFVIIVCPYQHLVEQWVEDIELFGMKPIIAYGDSKQKNWKKDLNDAIRDQKLHVRQREFICVVMTNATFSMDKTQDIIAKVKSDILLVADEAHNFGSEFLRSKLDGKYTYRLALSATLDRHGDEEGTEFLYHYFGKKCIEYDLERAINEKKLTPYKYYPIVTALTEKEYDKYDELSRRIKKCIKNGKNGKITLTEQGKRLALERARVVSGASEKVELLEDYITPYINDKHILVYCGAASMMDDTSDITETFDEDLRQIDVVTNLLGNKLKMKVSQFTSKEDMYERAVLKKEFMSGDDLQVLIAIKCLDEGVNIPAIKTAFILASTTNPKEYIQRRGRVLRLSKGKEYAEIYDFITLPRPLNEVSSITTEQIQRELTLVKNELVRAEEFARISLNKVCAMSIIDEIKDAYGMNEISLSYEEDYFNE